jgi:hypothetical protein
VEVDIRPPRGTRAARGLYGKLTALVVMVCRMEMVSGTVIGAGEIPGNNGGKNGEV